MFAWYYKPPYSSTLGRATWGSAGKHPFVNGASARLPRHLTCTSIGLLSQRMLMTIQVPRNDIIVYFPLILYRYNGSFFLFYTIAWVLRFITSLFHMFHEWSNIGKIGKFWRVQGNFGSSCNVSRVSRAFYPLFCHRLNKSVFNRVNFAITNNLRVSIRHH